MNADDEEQELRALTPEEAARLRSQMEDLLKRSDEARAVSAGKEEAMRYGREMWARCEALTAGAPLQAFLGLYAGSAAPHRSHPAGGLVSLWHIQAAAIFAHCMYLGHDLLFECCCAMGEGLFA